MTTDLESEISVEQPESDLRPVSWLKVGVVAAGSAFLGGLAAAWFYRNTLARFRQADEQMQDPESRSGARPPDSEE